MVDTKKTVKGLRIFSQALLFYALLVILWGAWVRISHSGDGCGDQWPLCQGAAIPIGSDKKTWTEFFHRASSGLFGVAVIFQYFWTKKYSEYQMAIKWSFISFWFMISEAILGAGLVKLGLVANNDSLLRPFVMSLHIINSMALVGSLTLVGEFLTSKNWSKETKIQNSAFQKLKNKIVWAVPFAFLLISITGAFGALSTTLFPSRSLLSGILQDLSPNSHLLLKARMLHPIIAFLLGGTIALTAGLSIQLWDPKDTTLRTRSQWLLFSTLVGMTIGLTTLLSLSPIWLKLSHLLMVYLIWIGLVLWLRPLLLRPVLTK